MFAIDRDQLAAVLGQRPLHHRPTGHQTLLVGQRDAIPALQTGHRRPQPGTSDNAVDNDGARDSCCVDDRIGAEFDGPPYDTCEILALLGGSTRHQNPRLGMGRRQLRELWRRRPCGEGGDLQPERGGHLDCLGPDGPGRPQNDHRAGHNKPNPRNRK